VSGVKAIVADVSGSGEQSNGSSARQNRVYLPTAVHVAFAQGQASLIGVSEFPVTKPVLICVNGIEFEAWNTPVLKPSTISLDSVQSFSVSTDLGELSGDISPKVVTPLSVPLTVQMFACATSSAHHLHTCKPLYFCHRERDYPKM